MKKFYTAPVKCAAALLLLIGLTVAGWFGSTALLAASVGCYAGEYYECSMIYHAQEEFTAYAAAWYEYSTRELTDYNDKQAFEELTERLQNSSLRAVRVDSDGTEHPIAGMQMTQNLEKLQYYHHGEAYGFQLYMDTSRPYEDAASFCRETHMALYAERWDVLIRTGIALAAALAGWIVLLLGAGRRADGALAIRGWHRFPFDVLTALIAVPCALITLPLEGYYGVMWSGTAPTFMKPLCAATAAALAGDVLLVLLWLHTAVARIKGRMLLRTTLIWRVLAWAWRKIHGGVDWVRQAGRKETEQKERSEHGLWKRLKQIDWRHNRLTRLGAKALSGLGAAARQVADLLRHIGVIWKLVGAAFALLLLAEFVAMLAVHSSGWMMLMLVLDILVVLLVAFFAVQLDRLKKGAQHLAGGDLDYKIHTDHMYWDLQEHAKNLNAISDGMAAAVERQLKSERMKYELLTNVSHDIKTPLTSIINYVDLLKGQNIPDGTARDYVEVLERQSGKLKKLITDLIEVSKATTGNITVHAERTHAGELLRQCVGEYDERLRDCQLEVVLDIPSQEPSIYADGRLLWRVFDNLLGNIVKYALAGTRVYVGLETRGNQVIISLKNISRERLNVAADELLERFVRGDAARSTEGSGLGLSIARSLTELMHGRFSLSVDGDLFKIVLTFEKMQDE